jgi:hypothetical protein
MQEQAKSKQATFVLRRLKDRSGMSVEDDCSDLARLRALRRTHVDENARLVVIPHQTIGMQRWELCLCLSNHVIETRCRSTGGSRDWSYLRL